jgi:hypothetical protein
MGTGSSPVRDKIRDLLQTTLLTAREISNQLQCSRDYVEQVGREENLTAPRLSRRRELRIQRQQEAKALARQKRCVYLHERYPAEYRVYDQAKHRCNDDSNLSYSNYGDRGIRFLYKSFAEFMKDVGPRPPGRTESGKRPLYTLDRKRNEGHYELGNCRWSTWVEQARNRRPRRVTPWQVMVARYGLEGATRLKHRQCRKEQLLRLRPRTGKYFSI